MAARTAPLLQTANVFPDQVAGFGRWPGIGMLLLLLHVVAAIAAAPAGPPERELKAAVVYQILKFVDWPEVQPTNAPLVVGLVGKSPLIETLQSLLPAAPPVQGRPLTIEKLNVNFPPSNHLRCHLLVFGEMGETKLAPLLGMLTNAQVLTISDTEHFCANGGIVGLRMVERQVQLEVNPAALEQARLRLSSRLLRQAKIVGKSPTAKP